MSARWVVGESPTSALGVTPAHLDGGLNEECRGVSQPAPLALDDLDPVLRQVLSEHGDKTLAWMRNEPGAWGYLAGQGVAATRRHLGRQLSDPERRMVWSRLWWWLEHLRQRL